jgi:ferredoxin--NADP+ reductase
MNSDIATTAPVLPEAKMHLIRPAEPAIGRVLATEACLKGKSDKFVRHIVIDVSGTELAGNFLAGQSFGVIPPGVDDRGRPHKIRLYSISSPTWGEDGQGREIAIVAERLIDERKPQRPDDDPHDRSLFLGVCSNYLCDRRVGDELTITGPNGRSFLLPVNPSDHDYVFIATGTGIAPFRAMAKELLERPGGPCDSRIHLVAGSAYTTNLIYDDLFRGFADTHENFNYHTAISREPTSGSGSGIYVDAAFEGALDHGLREVLTSGRALIYICGALGMQFGIYRVLARYGAAAGFLNIKDDELVAMDPNDWPEERMKRSVRPTKRCMVEVY